MKPFFPLRLGAGWKALCLTLALLGATGCDHELETRYGVYNNTSVNGTRTLVEMLRGCNFQVQVIKGLGQPLRPNVRTLLVFHDGFGPLSREAQRALTDLLDTGVIDVLVLVPRDSDETWRYWEWAAAALPPAKEATLPEKERERRARVREEAACSKQVFLRETSLPANIVLGDMKMTLSTRRQPPLQRVTSFVDELSPFADQSLDPGKFDFYQRRRLEPNSANDLTLWTANEEPLLVRHVRPQGEVYVVANGSFLLNAGLVNPENRKLAVNLVRTTHSPLPEDALAIATSTKIVADEAESSSWALFFVHPGPWVLGQVLALLVLYCWWRWPILGRPRVLEVREVSRFGRHVEALGELLAATGREDFARERLEQFRARADSGVRTTPPKPRR